MKDEDEIKDRIRSRLHHHLALRLEETGRRLPHRCVHNHRQPLDTQSQINGEPNAGYNRLERRHLPVVGDIGLCMVGADDPETWPGAVCQDPVDAQRCPLFTPIDMAEDVLRQFEANVADPVWLEGNLPDVHNLVWTLDQTPAYEVPWWRRWWLRLFPPKLEPVLPPFDPTPLLPRPSDALPRP